MLSSVSNWLCSAYTRQGGGSFGPRRSASRATLRYPRIPSQTESCQYNVYYSLGGNQTHPHDPHHHPIEGASPVQRVSRSVTRVWAKIPFDNRSGDLYITMQQLELHIPTATESRGQAAPPEMTRGFLGRGSASISWSGVAQCRGTRILHRRARSGTPDGGKSRFPNFIVSIPKIVDEVYRCHVGSSFWLSELR